MEKRLLLIEDDNLVASMLSTMLSKSGFVCDHAEDEAQAIRLFRNSQITDRPYDLVVVDLVLGENTKGGMVVMKEIREQQPGITAILCSGFTSSPIVENFRDFGFDFCLNKPFSWNRLKTILTELPVGSETA
jgi:DNA-binding response OmpR family regulator